MTGEIAVSFGVIGLVLGFIIFGMVKRHPVTIDRVGEIGDEIHHGAMVFIKREYSMLGMFALVLLVGLYFSLGWKTALAFLVGALASATAGWIGMYTATHANSRTTCAAKDEGPAAALSVAFFGGSIMGLAVASLGLIGLGSLYLVFGGDPETAHAIHGFGMGASTVALFSRVGGGIFTKSADVGADLVGKVEAGIPEDDPRNPGVIADNVGDNVGDVAGMGSDIFESYCGSMIATIAIASTLSAATLASMGTQEALMSLPLLLASAGLLSSILGIATVKLVSGKEPAVALRIGTMGATILFMVMAYFVVTMTGVAVG
ncbi:sodium/proton-translocating pyrophosphatase, partial [Solemya elarraichensis gill symbiont]